MQPKSFLFSVLLAMFVAPAVFAQDTPLESLDTWGRNRGWEGVGLLKIENRSTCTGAMIRPDLILTAAHCLFDGDSGERMDPRNIEFRAGWRDGKSIARRFGKSAVIHPKFLGGDGTTLSSQQIRYDVALLQLANPIYSTHADPFRTDRGVRLGANVSVVSYGKGRNDAASRQRACKVLDYIRGVVAMSCNVVPGSSGSPVFAMRDGRPRIVSVVSATGTHEGRKVSFGMDIELPLADILADFHAGRGVYPVAAPTARRITVGGDRNATGARFLRP